MMRKIDLDELHFVQKKMLKQIDAYCRKKTYNYCLWAGTLLGAIREEGFIPWDDDVDIAMPRKDYEKLLSEYHKNPIEDLDLVSFSSNDSYHLPFAKFIYKKSVLKEAGTIDQKLGIFIDVFPLDETPSGFINNSFQKARCKFHFYLQYLKLRAKSTDTGFRKVLNTFLFSFFVRKKDFKFHCRKVDAISRTFDEKDTGKLCVLTHSALSRHDYLVDDIFPLRESNFGGLNLFVPNNSHKVLQLQYGDYMTPPPDKERNGKHNLMVWIEDEK